MYNHNKAQQSKNRVHISWDILHGIAFQFKSFRFWKRYIPRIGVNNVVDDVVAHCVAGSSSVLVLAKSDVIHREGFQLPVPSPYRKNGKFRWIMLSINNSARKGSNIDFLWVESLPLTLRIHTCQCHNEIGSNNWHLWSRLGHGWAPTVITWNEGDMNWTGVAL